MTVASASVYPVETHWMVVSVVWNSRASVLMATLTTVTSRIDMMAPRTTTEATSIRPRSIVAAGAGGGGDIAEQPSSPEGALDRHTGLRARRDSASIRRP